MTCEEYLELLNRTQDSVTNPDTLKLRNVKKYLIESVIELRQMFKQKGYSLSCQSNKARTSYYLHCGALNYGTRVSTHTSTGLFDDRSEYTIIDLNKHQVINFINKIQFILY